MKVFVTGASGFIGSAVVKELLDAGHEVTGLVRSEESASTVRQAGAKTLQGTLEDLDILQKGASEADGVIHTAFIHDFTQYQKANEADKAAITAMGEALQNTGKPIIVTAGILGLPKINGVITEESTSQNSAPRSSEATAKALVEKGIHASVIRLPPSVHDRGDKGFVPFLINQARKNGLSAYVEEGSNHWPAVHRLDAARLFRLALEKSAKGALYNAIGDQGITVKEIATLIGQQLNLPVRSLSQEEAPNHFEWMSGFIGFDSPATSYTTQEQLGWKPQHIGLIEDLKNNYF
ncbi:SDR family oxidoreductase [Chryseobacterium sp. CT-SW4]|uniref:SDR family oxidoreductase n=1 Tax=Chryseobacterium sp. SW-1 TaxID=3157343 RepID=UPI003B02BB68